MTECDMPSAYAKRERRAKTYHRCCECRGKIRPGEYYHYHSGVWDGLGASYKRCADCENIACQIASESDECIAFGNLADEAYEHFRMPGEDGGPLWAAFCAVKEARGEAAE